MAKLMTSSVLSIVTLMVLEGVAGAQTQSPVQTFAALQPLIAADQEIVVWRDDGGKTRGKVIAVSGDTIEIRRPRLFRRAAREVIAESSVRRIDHWDSSTVKGGIIGAAVGLAVSVALLKTSQSENWSELPVAAASPVVGGWIGSAIDGAITRPLFVSPKVTDAVTGPSRSRGARVVVAASLRF
ncbi:MAG TPA: hypothetical protein VFZ31_05400 [Vicinamibacterales bacterium]